MSNLNLTAVIAAVRAAVEERNTRRDALGGRIAEIARETMSACALTEIARDADGPAADRWKLKLGAVHAVLSQWGDGSSPISGEAPCVLVQTGHLEPWRVVGAVPNCSTHDGRNMQRQHGAAHVGTAPDWDSGDLVSGPVAKPATVAMLRAVARELPEVVARLLAAREASARAQAAEAEEATRALAAR